ncbi:hypothetical protein Bbelb_252280 [Branchiostoma belcheri]|nr:hypothetical protein Bbelb_252280 [Branchiostoma belcheri]
MESPNVAQGKVPPELEGKTRRFAGNQTSLYPGRFTAVESQTYSGTSLDYETGRPGFDSGSYPNKSEHAPRRCTLGKGTLHDFPHFTQVGHPKFFKSNKMSDNKVTSLASKFKDLELCLKKRQPLSQKVGYRRALLDAIVCKDVFTEVEILKSLGDLRLEKAKLSKDSAEFDKAAALYAAALLRCKDPDVGETVEHRIRYMEKLCRQLLQGYSPHFRWLSPDYWGTADSNVLRVAEICDKLDRRVGKPWHSVEDIYTETLVTSIENSDMFLETEVLKSLGDFYLEKGKTTSDVSQFSKAAAMYNKALTTCRWGSWGKTDSATSSQVLAEDQRSCYKGKEHTDHLTKGDSSLARSDLDSAEQHFAAALKTVHVRDPTAQQYQREVEPLCKLGDVYSKRGQQTGDGGDFVKAAALYNAAIARSEDQGLNDNIEIAITEVEKAFLKCILGICIYVSQDDIEKHKKHLKEMRDQIKLEMETIDQQLDPYVHDEDDPCVKEIEAKRAQAVRQLFEKIAQQRKEFISLLVEECIGLMGPPPCKYALIGLGSQATGLVTPYSDLEFVILVEESEECLVYFRNLTHYLHLKVVNLGETILPALGIKSLNDFYSENPLDDWYYDSVTPRGFAFDGSMPKASKTPLGRQGTKNEPPSELICTPENMASKLQSDVTLYLKEGYHLATILRNPCLIAGDQDLIDTYMDITGKILQADGGKMAKKLALETQKENTVAVDCLALSSGIIPTTVWKTIEEMENQQVISPNNAHHLTVLTSISAELRLRTYIANGGQKENLSALAQAVSCYQEVLKEAEGNDAEKIELLNRLGLSLCRIGDNQRAVSYLEEAVSLARSSGQSITNPDIAMMSLSKLGSVYMIMGDYKKTISYHKQALQMYKTIYGQNEAHPHIAASLNMLGGGYNGLGDYRKAINYHEQALQMYRSIYGENTVHRDIATTLNNLGMTWKDLSDFQNARHYLEQSLKMRRSMYGHSTAHPDIATALRNLGMVWRILGDHRKAISYHEQALLMDRIIFGQSTPHPDTATALNNLGSAWSELGDIPKAISYHEQALQMHRSIYGQNKAHPDIARILSSLGNAWDLLGDHRKAISYHEQALQIKRASMEEYTTS